MFQVAKGRQSTQHFVYQSPLINPHELCLPHSDLWDPGFETAQISFGPAEGDLLSVPQHVHGDDNKFLPKDIVKWILSVERGQL